MMKTLHVGSILIDKETVCLTLKGKRQECLSELNNWLFDFCHANSKTMVQLPPLDDWDRSEEDPSWWSFSFADILCKVSLKVEYINFL
jgi:hypothetical protein